PDYLVNAGGLIQVADELEGYQPDRVMEKTRGIYDMLLRIYERSQEQRLPTSQAADQLVLERLHHVADLKRIFLGLDRRGRSFSGQRRDEDVPTPVGLQP